MQKKAFLLWMLVLTWMCVIFYFSSKPISESHAQSYFILEIANKVLNSLGIHSQIVNDAVNFILRKTAHISEYAVLGVLLYTALLNSNIRRKKAVFVCALVICILYSTSDEIHQIFVQGRSASIADVMIDTIGSCLGLIAIVVCRAWKKKIIVHGNNN